MGEQVREPRGGMKRGERVEWRGEEPKSGYRKEQECVLGLRGRECGPKETGRVRGRVGLGSPGVAAVSRGGEAGVWLLSWPEMGSLLADQMGCLGAPRVGVPVSSLCSRGGHVRTRALHGG